MYQERGISLGLSVILFSEMLAIYRNSNSRRRAYVALYPSGDCRAIISQATIRSSFRAKFLMLTRRSANR